MIYSEPTAMFGILGSTYNHIATGTERSSDKVFHGAYLTAAEAYKVDNKIDDGVPHTVQLITRAGYNTSAKSWYSGGTNCVTSNSAPSAYMLSDTVPSCRQYYYLGAK